MTKTEALGKLYQFREQIQNNLSEIDAILQIYFAEEYDVAYQHWIPQVLTALSDSTKWLSRGQYSMDYSLKRIEDRLFSNNKKGVSKYIK